MIALMDCIGLLCGKSILEFLKLNSFSADSPVKELDLFDF
jgi:hypothetical protein